MKVCRETERKTDRESEVERYRGLQGRKKCRERKKKKQSSESEAAGPWGQAPKSPPPPSTNKSSGGNGLFWVGGIAAAMIFAIIAISDNDEPRRTTTVTAGSPQQSSCNTQASKCSDERLCHYATIGSGSTKRWDPQFPNHERLAKARGLRCGVSATKLNSGTGRIDLSRGEWKLVSGKCAQEVDIYNSPFSRISLQRKLNHPLRMISTCWSLANWRAMDSMPKVPPPGITATADALYASFSNADKSRITC